MHHRVCVCDEWQCVASLTRSLCLCVAAAVLSVSLLRVRTYEPAIDISEMVSLENVMEELELGPNGGASLTIHAWRA